MNNNLQVFNFKEHAVRIIMCDGEPWFVAKGVCEILEISKYRDAITKLDDDERCSVKVDTLNGAQKMTAISESGLYALIMRSNKPEAKKFRKLVTSEVLPSTRKAGYYKMNKKPEIDPKLISAAKIILDTAGITGNQATLSLDKLYRFYTGDSALQAMNTELKALEQEQLLTPTEIGRELNLNGRRVNEILAGMGYQHKINGSLEAICDGINYSVMLDVGKRHSDGTPVRQLKWNTNVIRLVKERL